MVVTIQQVLRPLLIINFIMGLGAYPVKQPNPRIQCIEYLSVLYSLTVWFSYVYLLYYVVTSLLCKILCDHPLYLIIVAINTYTAISSAIMCFYHRKKFELNLKKLSTVDDSLEKLGVPKTYQKIRTCFKFVIIGWITNSLVKTFLDAVWFLELKETYSRKFFLFYIINHSTNINMFVDLLFIFLLWYISTRFDKMNEHMRCLLVREDHGLRCTRQKSMIIFHRHTLCTDDKLTLWTSMHLHLELCRIVRELNFIFGTHITFGILTNLIYVMAICYGLCMMLMRKYSMDLLQSPFVWFITIYFLFLLLIRLYALNYICETVMDKASKIDKIIHQLITFECADVCQQLYQFTLQVMHRPLKLTGLNLFYLGNECLRKFCLTVVTYVIIMREMKIHVP